MLIGPVEPTNGNAAIDYCRQTAMMCRRTNPSTDLVYLSDATTARSGMRQCRLRLAGVAAVLAAAALALVGCSDGTTTGANSPPSAQPDVHQLVGSQWLLTEIANGGTLRTVPEALKATWQFTGDRQFLASDTVNAISGRYRFVNNGFATIDAATTLVGYVGSDPVRLAVISGFQRMTIGTVAVSVVSPAQVTMRVPGFVMTFRRLGAAQTFPAPSPTSSASH